MTTDPILNAQKRAIQYWYVDGSFELSFGGLCLLLAGYFYAMYHFAGSWVANVLSVLFALVMIGGSLVVNRLMLLLKERVTFPRTGYVAYTKKRGLSKIIRALVIGILSALISAVMVLIIVNRPPTYDWVVGLSGLMFGAALAFLGFRTSLARFYVNAAISLVSGIGLGFANLPENIGLVVYYGIIGLALLGVGGLTLHQYVRENPKVKDGEK